MQNNIRTTTVLVATGAVFALIGSCIVQPPQSQYQQQPYGQHAQGGQGYGDGHNTHDTNDGFDPEGDYAMPDGAYWCTIADYPAYECLAWTGDDGVQWVEKQRGSQRFRGRIVPTNNGFRFEGTYYCPFGNCTENVQGDFVAYDDGLYKGSLSGTRVTPVMFQFQPGGFGGNAYGGGIYGGNAYGALRYGLRPAVPHGDLRN